MTATSQRSVPWSVADARLALPRCAVAAASLGWGWWVSSGTAKVDHAVPGIVFGIVAVMTTFAVARSWIAAGRRRVRLRSAELSSRIDVLAGSWSPAEGETPEALVGVAGLSRYHREDCLLVQGKQVERLSDDVRRLRRRTPCEMCRP